MINKSLFRAVTAAAVLVTALSLCACGAGASKDKTSITIGIPQDIAGLDPHTSSGAGTKEVLFNIYEGLLKPQPDGNMVPAVAESYTISDDGSVYSFVLREGIKFHDGTDVTPEDVKYSIERNAGKDGNDPLISAFSAIDSVEVDGNTITVKLKEGNTDFLAYMSVAIVPEHIEDLNVKPVGTGPYMYVSRSPQENIILKKFDNYWGEKAYIRDVTLKIVSDPDTVVMNMEGGSIDMFARVTTVQMDQLSKDKFTFYEGTMNLVQAMYLNNRVIPFDDVRVRQALCYAVDPQEIMNYVSDGAGTEIGSSMFPAFSKYYMEELNHTYDRDIDKAKKLLEEAGYPDGFSFTLTVPSNYPQHVDTAQVIADELKDIGVDVKIQEVEWNSWLTDVYSGREYEATVVGVDASNLTASALLSRFVSDAHNNFCNFSDPEYDAMYAKAMASVDDAEKTAAFKECERILSEKAANVYIQDLPEFVALSNKFTGYTFYPLYVQDIAKIKPAD